MSNSAEQVMAELDATPEGAERVQAAQSTLVAIYAGLMEDPGDVVKTRCVDIIREDCLRGMPVDQPNGAGSN